MALAAPVAPAGASPAGPVPEHGVDLYLAPAAPALAAGVEVGLGRTAIGVELAWIWLGALRPEVHARWPCRLGKLVVAPHVSVAYALAAHEFDRAPAQNTLEGGTGVLAAWVPGPLSVFADGGALGLYDLQFKAHVRVFGTFAFGMGLRASERVAVSGWIGALTSRGVLAPAGGVILSLALRTGG